MSAGQSMAAAILVFITTTINVFAVADPAALPAESAFQKAVGLMGKRQFREAIPYLERVRKELPENSSVLWNLGIARAELREHERAIEVWKTYCRIVPDDWQGKAKLIQAYQGMGDLKARDAEIGDLYKLRETSSDPKLKSAEKFCREQTVIGGRSVFAFEYFSPEGARRRYLRFSVLNKDGTEDFYLSLGSYDDTTEIARELGQISKEQRIYHLDEYRKNAHRTYGMFQEQPDYDKVREIVLSVLEGKQKPISASAH
ncbi:MAG: tetratricopeptide repeat protein [Chthoniobacterales bacterium]